MHSDDVTASATRAVIYAAKSTKDEHGSVPGQLSAARAAAEKEGREIVAELSEEDVSGYRKSRGPRLEEAMEAAKEAAADRGKAELWVFHSSRLARGSGLKNEARALGEVYYDLKRHGVALRSVEDDPYVTDEAFVGMASKMANKYSEDLSGYVKAGIKRRREGGKHHGGQTAYGYKVGEDGLEIVCHEAEVVRRIFSEFVAGKSQTKIARDLQREGVPTSEGGKWGPSTIFGILTNPVHIGKVRHNGEVFPGLHEGIIEEKTWQQAADLLGARPERRGRPSKGRHLFRGGMLRCQCGGAMVPRTTKGDNERYYCDGHSKLGDDFCNQKPIARELIDTAVYAYFESVGLDIEATRQQLTESRDRKLGEVRALLGEAEREAQRARERLDRVRRDYQDGKLAADDWAEQRDQLTGELDGAEAEADRLRDQEHEVTAWGELRDVEADVLHQLSEIRKAIAGEIDRAEDVDAVRAAFSRLFARFVISPRDPKLWRKSRPKDFAPKSVEYKSALLDTDGYGFLIDVWVRTDSLLRPGQRDGYDENWHPILRREPLQQAENNQRRSSVPS